MTKLYLTYEEYREGGEISPGQEDSEWPDYEDINNDWSPKQLLLNKGDNWKVEELELDNVKIGDVVYVIVLRYSTGNTFGRENGCWSIVKAVKTSVEADKIYKKIENLINLESQQLGYWRYSKSKEQRQKYKETEKLFDETRNILEKELDYYFPCFGYFEGFERLEIYPMRVDP